MAEYAARYGVPAPEMKWPLFLALALRAPMFWARERLVALVGVQTGIGTAFGGGSGTEVQDLVEAAYPVKRHRPKWIRNTLAEGPGDEGDGDAEA